MARFRLLNNREEAMPTINYDQIPEKRLEEVIRDVIETRCQKCSIKPDDLLSNIFNMNWIKQWIRAGMPLDRRDQDFKYEALMMSCREELREKLI